MPYLLSRFDLRCAGVLTKRRAFPLFFMLRIIFVLAVLSSVRVLFYFFNKSTFNAVSFDQLAEAFLLGFRFDAWVVFVALMPSFLLELAAYSTRWRVVERITAAYSWLVLVLFSSLMFFELSDCEYYQFSGKRTTLAIFSVTGDALEQSVQLLTNFWHIPFLTFIYAGVFYWIWRFTGQLPCESATPQPQRHRVWTTAIVGIVIGLLAIRGGLQRKPLSPSHTAYLGDSNLSALALNTTVQMVHSARSRVVKKLDFFLDESELFQKLQLPVNSAAAPNLSGSNVVVLIVEGLSSEYMGYRGITKSYTPFLSELAQKSLYFENSFANGRQSIEAMPSILASFPSLIGEPFVTSIYGNVPIPALGSTLAKHGYTTAFFHGAKNGSMYIDAMAKKFGFNQFFGMSEYPEASRDFDGSWGVFDEPFLKFTVEKMSAFQKPFVSGIFTLSSHNPYRIPQGLESSLPADGTPFQRSLSYSDYSIRRFFETAQTQDWYNNTLFVITGDHTAELADDVFKSEQNIYRVPIIFFDPSGRLGVHRSNRLSQHADIFPSVLDLLRIDLNAHGRSALPFGQSVFLPEQQARVVNRSGEWFWYQEGSSLVRIQTESESEIELWRVNGMGLREKAEFASQTSIDKQCIERAKAYLQYYNLGLIRGRY